MLSKSSTVSCPHIPNNVKDVEIPDFLSDEEAIANVLNDITKLGTHQVAVKKHLQTETNAHTCNLNTF